MLRHRFTCNLGPPTFFLSLTLFMFIWLLASKFTICIIALNFFLKKRKVKKICIYSKCLGIRYILVGPFGNKLFVLKCTRNFQLNFSDHPNMAQSSHFWVIRNVKVNRISTHFYETDNFNMWKCFLHSTSLFCLSK